MANLYYNAAVDTAWDTLGNWWDDVSFTIPAASLPATGDTVYLAAQMDSGPSVEVTLNHIYVADASTGGGNFGVVFTGATGDATFNGYSGNNYGGTVSGDATFNDSSYNSNGGNVSGNATFNGYSYNYGGGNVTGGATFNGNSGNYGGTVSGNATFNGYSYNYGTGIINGGATFNDYSYNNQGYVYGGATFNDYSYNNQGYVYGGATFNDSSYNQGAVDGGATFSLTSAAIQIFYGYVGTYGSVTIESGAAGSGDQMIARLLNLPWFINL